MSAGVRKDAQSLLALSGLETCELSLMLVGDRAIRKLNRDFRSQNKATDVLSFPQLEEPDMCGDKRSGGRADMRSGRASACPLCAPTMRSQAREAARNAPPLPLGDIVISIDTARRQARELGVSPRARMRTLMIHGLLHLLGYDHEHTAAEARRMFAWERELAARLGGAGTPRACAASPRHDDPGWPPAAMPPPVPATSVTRRRIGLRAARRRGRSHTTTTPATRRIR